MAATCLRNVLLGRTSLLDNHVPMLLAQVRDMSRYNKSFLNPVVDKNELSKPLDEKDPRLFQPIKATPSSKGTVATYDPLVEKMINMIMRDGKRMLARDILDQALEHIKRKQIERYHRAADADKEAITLDPVQIFYMAVDNCKPILITQRIRVGGIMYEVPVNCRPHVQLFKSIKWLIDCSKEKDRTIRFHFKLASELLDASNNQGRAVRRKQDLHKLCEANKAYASFKNY